MGAENIALGLDSNLTRVAELINGERFTPETAFHIETTLGLACANRTGAGDPQHHIRRERDCHTHLTLRSRFCITDTHLVLRLLKIDDVNGITA